MMRRYARPEQFPYSQDLPVPVLLRCVARLDPKKVPATVNQQLAGSLKVMPRRQFGADDVVVVAGRGWQLDEARMGLTLNRRNTFARPKLTNQNQQVVATFARVAEFGNPLILAAKPPETTLTLEYPDTPRVRLVLGNDQPKVAKGGPGNEPRLRITTIEFDTLHLSLVADSER
mgnify:FL=1